MISMISSVGKNRELGKDNNLVWRIPADMRFFKETTMGHTVIMGRNTYESISNGLPGRKMIVLSSRNLDGHVEIVSNVDEILNRYFDSEDEIFIIGGASVYDSFIEYADMLYLTEIDATCEDADTYFPEFDKNDWDREEIATDTYKDIDYVICKYKRKIRKKVI